MKRKTNKTKEEAWSQTAHAPDGEQPGPEASDTSGQSVPKSKFRKKSQQEQAAAAKLHMESQGEKLEQAREKLAKQKPPKKPGPVKRIGRVASGSVHSFVHGKIFEVEQENVGTEGAHRSELVVETALRHGSRFVRRKVREHPAKVVRKAEARYTKYTADYHFHTAAQEHPELTKNALTRYWQKQRLRRQYRKQAKEAAKQSHAHSFIKRLPDGYNTYITEDGGNLSQGQKQLLCITRVMLDLPPMLILDEATSSIDTRTEIRIQRAFAKMMKGRTSFVVAHRLSTIKESDVILVMKDGHIIEQGNHETLLAKGGFYTNLYNSQFAR